jgi:hypothetical protein
VVYDREVMPRIQQMSVSQLTRLTGLSQFHCWKVRKGERRLHARHWEAVTLKTTVSDSEPSLEAQHRRQQAEGLMNGSP